MKRLISMKKTALPSLRKQDWKTVKAETEKINDITNIPNEQHHRTKRSNPRRRETSL